MAFENTKFVKVKFQCGHSKTYTERQADRMIIGERCLCFVCGRKTLVTSKQIRRD